MINTLNQTKKARLVCRTEERGNHLYWRIAFCGTGLWISNVRVAMVGNCYLEPCESRDRRCDTGFPADDRNQ